MTETWIVIFIMTLSGAAGGYANWILTPADPERPEQVKLKFFGYMSVGVVAAFTVPLFLSMAQSDLLTAASTDGSLKEKLIFSGFCIVASFSSRAFMISISEKLIQQVKSANKNAIEAKATAEQADEGVDELRDNVELRETGTQATLSASAHAATRDVPLQNLTLEESRALRATGQMTTRTRTGIAKDAGVSTSSIGEIIDSLAQKGLIERTRSERTGGLRFQLTSDGIRKLNNGE